MSNYSKLLNSKMQSPLKANATWMCLLLIPWRRFPPQTPERQESASRGWRCLMITIVAGASPSPSLPVSHSYFSAHAFLVHDCASACILLFILVDPLDQQAGSHGGGIAGQLVAQAFAHSLLRIGMSRCRILHAQAFAAIPASFCNTSSFSVLSWTIHCSVSVNRLRIYFQMWVWSDETLCRTDGCLPLGGSDWSYSGLWHLHSCDGTNWCASNCSCQAIAAYRAIWCRPWR